MMKKAINGFGLTILLLAYGGSLLYLGWREFPANGAARPVVIRLAHYQLESGLREAFAAVARAYEARHPEVQVELLAVPSRAFDSWLRVQLVGEQAPDLVELGSGGITEDLLATYFTPLTAAVARPNPYLAGTALAGGPWRDSFVDGLQSHPSFNTALHEVYGVPNAHLTIRVFCNRALWRRLLGSRPFPRTYAEFGEVCRLARARVGTEPAGFAPFVTGQLTAAITLERLFESQTQRLLIDLPGNEAASSVDPKRMVALAALRRDWTLETPAVRSGLELIRDASALLPTGFLQMAREDALMQFVQGRALMILTGVWEAPSLRQLADFPLDAFVLPLPDRDDPRFGGYVLGPLSEAGSNTQAVLGLTRQSRNPEVAIDFLRFMTGSEGSRLFARQSGWPAAMVGTPPPPGAEAFAPVLQGYTGGFHGIINLQGSAYALQRTIATHLSALIGPAGSVSAFTAVIRPEYERALVEDCVMFARTWRDTSARQDTAIYAYCRLGAADRDSAEKAEATFGVQAKFDSDAARYAWEVRRAQKRGGP